MAEEAEPQVHIETKENKFRYKIIIIGDGTVGKTSLIRKYVKHQIDNEYMPTVGASISKQPVTLGAGDDAVKVSLLIFDIGGQLDLKNYTKCIIKVRKESYWFLISPMTNPFKILKSGGKN